jgi:tRNA A-37 threonylcarbamoyl transferase component Bud32
MQHIIKKLRNATGVTVRAGDIEMLTQLDECGYHAVRHKVWRGFAMAGVEESGDFDRIVSIAEAIRTGAATPIKQRNNRTAATTTLRVNGRELLVYIKEDDLAEMGVRKFLKDNIQASRPWKTWQRTLQLQAAGVAVQPPIAVLEYRRLGLVRKAVYVGKYASDAVSVARLLGVDGPAGVDRHRLLVTLADALRRMHDRGFYHGDLKAGNILVVQQPDRWDIRFIDLEGVVAKRHLTDTDRAIDLGRLWLALLSLTTQVERERLLECYVSIEPRMKPILLRRLVELRVQFLGQRHFGNLPAVGERLRADSESAVVRPRHWLIVAMGYPQLVRAALPLLATLRRSFPTVRFDMAVSPEAVPLLAQHPDLHAVLPVARCWWRRSSGEEGARPLLSALALVRSRRYEVTMDLADRFDSALLTRATGAPVRIGYRGASIFSKWPKRVACYTQMILATAGQRDPVRHCLLVAQALGLDVTAPERAPGPGAPLSMAASAERSPS